jgi:hypothetical protein
MFILDLRVKKVPDPGYITLLLRYGTGMKAYLMERTGPAVENFSKSMASVTSGAKSPTYLPDTGLVEGYNSISYK